MKQINFGYDDNLGLPSDLGQRLSCKTRPYHDLGQLIELFATNKLDCIFIPAGTLPYVQNYELISQSLLGSDEKDSLRTNFVTTKDFLIQDITKHSFGRVNEYCTTSYWAPMIYLMQVLPKHSHLTFKNTNGFEDLLKKTAAGIIDGSMVWDVILQKNPVLDTTVQTLFSIDQLPTPVIIAHKEFPKDLVSELNSFRTADKNSFFTGFKPINSKLINDFQTNMKKAIDFYNLQF